MYGLAMTGKNGEILYIEKLTKKNAYTSKNKFDARRFYSPGEAAMAFRNSFGEKFRIFSKYTTKGVFVVKL